MSNVRLSTSKGDILIKLDHENTPKTAANFEEYVKDGHYDGVIFHRVIKDFMIQGGGFNIDMQELDTLDNIENEGATGGKNVLGSIAMARTMDPHSASAQFFINTKDNDFLNYKEASMQGWGYCVFGNVIEGLEVVKEIQEVATTSRAGHQDVPVEPIVINKAAVE